MATIEELTTAAQTAIDALKTDNGGAGMFAQVNNVRREFTSGEYDQAVVDKANSDFDLQENGYKTARQAEYEAIAEQLDMLFHDMTADKGDKTGEWYKAIKAVKDANPKPE